MISHAEIYGTIGDSRAHIYATTVSVTLEEGGGGGPGRLRIKKKPVWPYEDKKKINNDDEIIFITTMFLTLINQRR